MLRYRTGVSALGIPLLVSISGLPGKAIADEGQSSAVAVAAGLLARAEAQSHTSGRARQLGATLQSLDRLGVHPTDPASDPRAAWRRIARFAGEPDYRGRVLGPAFARGQIGPGQSIRLEQQFLGGQPSDVAISGVPSGPLELAVTDRHQNTVCRSARSCSWTPVYTDRFMVTVRNAGRVAQVYYLVTN